LRPRTWLPLLFFFALATACSLIEHAPRPNLLLIVVDDLRFDALSRSAGAARTPSLQRLAADGTSFPWCFSHSPDTLAAHASLLSGTTPQRHGMLVAPHTAPAGLPLAAAWLAEHGYRTEASLDLRRFGAEDGPSGLERGFATTTELDPASASAHDVNAAILPRLARAPGAEPWFALIDYSDLHAPYDAYGTESASATVTLDGRKIDEVAISEGGRWRRTIEIAPGRHELAWSSTIPMTFAELAGEGETGPAELKLAVGRAGVPGRRFVVDLENPEDRSRRCEVSAVLHDLPSPAQARKRYKLEVENIDHAIGELVEALHASGQYDQTCIVLTADHGAGLSEHGAIADAANLYDEMLRVPLLVKPPKGSPRTAEMQKRLYTFLRGIDVVATALDLVGVPPLPGSEGISLFSTGERTLRASSAPPGGAPAQAMRDELYKLIYRPDEDRYVLYDVRSDTLETDDVFTLRGHLRADWQRKLRWPSSGDGS
jgi:arylsulfatase A-like enzyme